MNFNLNEDQLAYVELALQFSVNALAPHAAPWDAEAIFPISTLQQACELGFCGLYSDPTIGGLGLSRLDTALIFEQLAMGCTTTAMLTIHNMATWMVSSYATVATKTTYGPKLTRGELLASYCLTEPNAGSIEGVIGQSICDHRKIVAALKIRDPIAAYHAMANHLIQIELSTKEALEDSRVTEINRLGL